MKKPLHALTALALIGGMFMVESAFARERNQLDSLLNNSLRETDQVQRTYRMNEDVADRTDRAERVRDQDRTIRIDIGDELGTDRRARRTPRQIREAQHRIERRQASTQE